MVQWYGHLALNLWFQVRIPSNPFTFLDKFPKFSGLITLFRKNSQRWDLFHITLQASESCQIQVSFTCSHVLYVSVWYGNSQFLGLKLANFCPFYSLNNHKNTYKVVYIAKGTSAATPAPKNHKNRKLFVRAKITLWQQAFG